MAPSARRRRSAAKPTGSKATTRYAHGPRTLDVVRFGQEERLEIAPDQVLTIPEGLVGIDGYDQYAIVEDWRIAPCRWLQSLDDPALAFVVVDPHLLDEDYGAEIGGEEARELRIEDPGQADLWAIVTINEDPRHSTANLLAPVVVNRQKQLGKQAILNDSHYSLHHPLIPPSESRDESRETNEGDGGAVALEPV